LKEDENFVTTSVSFDRQTLKRADEIVEKKEIDGVRTRSALIEYALQKVFKELSH